jgi:hypothetical protein
LTNGKENKRITANLTGRSGGESPARAPKGPTKALFATLEQSWRRLADRFTAPGSTGPKSSETLQTTRIIRMDRTWGCDWLADRSFGQPVMIVGNYGVGGGSQEFAVLVICLQTTLLGLVVSGS